MQICDTSIVTVLRFIGNQEFIKTRGLKVDPKNKRNSPGTNLS